MLISLPLLVGKVESMRPAVALALSGGRLLAVIRALSLIESGRENDGQAERTLRAFRGPKQTRMIRVKKSNSGSRPLSAVFFFRGVSQKTSLVTL